MLLRTLLYLALPAIISASPACYWPDGTLAQHYTSCGENTSQCCSDESICLTNGYCMSTVKSLSLSRATCSDRTWRTCKNPCQGVDGRQNGGCSLVLYSSTEDGALYCPNAVVANSSYSVGCTDGVEPFSIGPANIVMNKAALAGASCARDLVNPTRGATASQPANTASASATSTSTSVPTCTSDKSNGGSSSRDTAIGAGVGVPLGVIACAAIGWALFERKKRYHLINSPPPPPVMMMQPEMGSAPKSELSASNQAPQELEAERYDK